MTQIEAKNILKRIEVNPDLIDQFTEEEIKQLEYIACGKKA